MLTTSKGANQDGRHLDEQLAPTANRRQAQRQRSVQQQNQAQDNVDG
jgi:hypothetical protein